MSRRNENRKGYKKTKVGWIPEEWDVFPFSKVAVPSKKKYDPQTNPIDYKCIELEHIEKGTGRLVGYIQSKAQTSIKNFFFKGDVLFGKLRPYLRKYVLCNFDGVCSTEIWVLKNTDCCLSQYLFLIVQTNRFIAESNKTSGTKMPRADWGNVKHIPIPLPPLPEQKKIAEILSAWDRAIEQVGRLIDAKQRLKKGLMQQLLTGRMRFPEFGKHAKKKGEMPEGWGNKQLGSLGAFLKGKGINNSQKKEVGLPCITYGEIYTKHDIIIRRFFSFIGKTTAQKSQLIQRNDILFTGSGETLDEIGKCVAYIKDIEAYAGGDIIIFRPKDVNSLYLSYSLNSNLLIRQKRKLGQGHSVVHIYPSGLKLLQVPLPFLAEQSRIATTLSTCDREIELLKKKQKKLKEQKKGLMQKLLTGEIRHPQFLKEGHS